VSEHVAIAINKEVLLTTVNVSFDDINNSHFGHFSPRKESRYPNTRDLVGPTRFWTGVLNIIFLAPQRDSKPEPSTP
jgi:hypothetical protein